MKKALLLCVIFLNLIMFSILFGQVDGPKEPAPPEVDSVESETFLYDITVHMAGEQPLKGKLSVTNDSFTFVVRGGKIMVEYADVKSITVHRWRKASQTNSAYAFYPSEIVITLKDKTEYSAVSLQPFHSFLMVQKEQITLYTYFYDYWKNEAWENSRNAEENYPETHPLNGTVTKIVFN